MLQTRKEELDVFQHGAYAPLTVVGPQAEHVLALARHHAERWIVAVIPIGVQHLIGPRRDDQRTRGLPQIDWGTTAIQLPSGAPHRWRDALAMTEFNAKVDAEGASWLAANRCLSPLPVALLTSLA
jgi:maltooligosyltrehalose synthase